MSAPKPTSGTVKFAVPDAGKECQTWYTIYGQLTPDTTPLVVLHGGPGVPHNYLLPLVDLVTTHKLPVIFYDQLGCGNSTHLPERMGDGAFWTEQLFMDELENLVEQLGVKNSYYVLGQSWGGMLGSRFASRHPTGLKKMVISNSPADMVTWVKVADRLRLELPEDVQAELKKHEANGTTESQEYEDAVDVYYQRHLCRVQPYPADYLVAAESMKKDPTVQWTMNGHSEFFVTGTLKNWSVVDDLHKIKVPTLVLNGAYDEAQDECVEPFVKLIPDVKWVRFEGSSHFPQWEERELYVKTVGDWLTAT